MTAMRAILAWLLALLTPPEAPMSAKIVPCVWTPFQLDQLDDAIQAGHHQHFGFPLWPPAMPVVHAMMVEEHGVVDGKLHGVPCFSMGNFDAMAAELADPSVEVFQTVPEREVIAGSPAKARHWRVASADPAAGMTRWWAVMASGRFSPAVDILHGDLVTNNATTKDIDDALARKLRELGYYTADEATYQRALERISAAAA